MNQADYNQYAPPTATVSDVAPSTEGVSELKYWSAKGRIGRMRYLAYTFGGSLLYIVLVGLAGLGAAVVSLNGTLLTIVQIALYIAVMVFTVLTCIKRCHDLNISGWWCLTLIVPILGLLFLFVPGTKGGNRFGPPPLPNTTGVTVLGLGMPVIMLVVAVAFGVPAYKEVENARLQSGPPVGQP